MANILINAVKYLNELFTIIAYISFLLFSVKSKPSNLAIVMIYTLCVSECVCNCGAWLLSNVYYVIYTFLLSCI